MYNKSIYCGVRMILLVFFLTLVTLIYCQQNSDCNNFERIQQEGRIGSSEPKNVSIVCDCSYRNLTKIPENLGEVCDCNDTEILPGDVNVLLLNNNDIQKFTAGFFLNFTNLLELDISSNVNVTQLDTDALKGLDNLQVLIMRKLLNGTKYDKHPVAAELPDGFFSPLYSLRELDMTDWSGRSDRHIRNFGDAICSLNKTQVSNLTFKAINEGGQILWIMKPPLFSCLRHLQIKYLDLRHNSIITLKEEVLKNFIHLEYLDLSTNFIFGDENIVTANLSYMRNLVTLNMSLENFVQFPRPVCVNSSPYGFELNKNKGPREFEKGHQFSNITCKRYIYLPPKLRYLYISKRNSVLSYYQEACVHPNNSLEHLDMRLTWATRFSFGYDFNYPHLKFLDFSSCRLVLTTRDTFAYMSNLVFPNISNTYTFYLNEKDHSMFVKWNELFANTSLDNVKILDMSHNGLKGIPGKVPKAMPNVYKLYMNNNKIKNIPSSLNHFANLTFLDLSYNRIVTISDPIRRSLQYIVENKGDMAINLTGNELICTCSDFPLVQWIHRMWFGDFKNHLHFIGLSFNLEHICKAENVSHCKINITSVTKQAKNEYKDLQRLMTDLCAYDSRKPILHLSLYAMSLLLVVMFGLLLKFQNYTIYLYYMAKAFVFNRRNQTDLTDSEFDAMVCYCQKDYDFVINKLRPVLETEFKYQLCIHHRDFIPGLPISVNIMNTILKSRRVIFVVSKASIRSRFINFELQLALEHCSSRVICILFNECDLLEVKTLLPTLEYFLKTNTYIVWPRQEEGRDVFFARLKDALGRPLFLAEGGRIQ